MFPAGNWIYQFSACETFGEHGRARWKRVLLVSQDKMSVTQLLWSLSCFDNQLLRQPDNNWLRIRDTATTDHIQLQSLQATIRVADIDTQVDLKSRQTDVPRTSALQDSHISRPRFTCGR